MIFRRFALSVALIIAIGADAFYQVTVVSAAAEDGQLAFNNVCRTCHTLGEGDNRLGPSLPKITAATAIAMLTASKALRAAKPKIATPLIAGPLPRVSLSIAVGR